MVPTLYIYLSIYLSIYLCICQYIYLSIYLFIFVSIYLFIFISFYLFIYLSNYLSSCVSVYLFIYLSIYLFVCLSHTLVPNWVMVFFIKSEKLLIYYSFFQIEEYPVNSRSTRLYAGMTELIIYFLSSLLKIQNGGKVGHVCLSD